MSENTIDSTVTERATIARWENEGGRALPIETRAAPADRSRSDSRGGMISVEPRVRPPIKRSSSSP